MKKASLLPLLIIALFTACTSTADNNSYNQANAAHTSNANTPANSNQGLKNENGGSGIAESDEQEVVIKIVDDTPGKCKLLNPAPDSVTLSEVKRERILWRVVNDCTAADADDIRVRIEGFRGHMGTPSTKKKPFGEGDDCDNKFAFNKVEKSKRTRFLSKDVRFECDAPATECRYKYTVKAKMNDGTSLPDVDPEVVINRTP